MLTNPKGIGGLPNAAMFSTAWQSQLQSSQTPFQNCVIQLLVYAEGGWNSTTNTYDPVTETLIFEGRARIQPVRSPRRENVTDNRTHTQVVRFQVADTTADVRPDMWVRVTDGGLNPNLPNQEYKVTEIHDSGNLIERTFEAVTDVESIPA